VAVLGLVALPILSPPGTSSIVKIGTTSASTSEPYSLVKSNETVTGGIASQFECNFPFNPGCPIPYGAAPFALHGLELISYNGSLYYRYEAQTKGNFLMTKTTVVSLSGEISTATTTALVGNPTFTVWFTNSSIYCAGEDGYGYEGLPSCPG
jgi:hypothetical protein